MTTVSLPARCAVAVVCGEHLVSQVYPAAVPVEVYFDNVVELLSEDLRRRGIPGLETGIAYELHRANGNRLDLTRSLDDLGVEDGMTLVLAPAGEGEAFEPQCESLSSALAGVGKRLFTPVTTETAAQTALAILGVVVSTVLGLAAAERMRTDSIVPGLVAGTTGLLLAGGGFAVWRWWPRRRDLLSALAWFSVPLLAGGTALGIPGRLGAAHLFVAALMMAVLTGIAAVVTQGRVMLAATTVTLSVAGALIAGIRMFTDAPVQKLGIAALVVLLVLLTISPTIALWSARIRPPHFGSITGRDLFRRSDGMPIDVVVPVDDDSDEDAETDSTPSGTRIADAARRANGVLTGICAGSAIALPAAIWATVTPEQEHGNAAAVLALLFVLIFISRARVFADRRQAVALVCGAVAGFCAGVVHVGVPLAVAAVTLVAFGCAALAAALAVPGTRFTPLVRMGVEWLELLAVVAALPLSAWLVGLFAWVRMR